MINRHQARVLAHLITAFVTVVMISSKICVNGCTWSFRPEAPIHSNPPTKEAAR